MDTTFVLLACVAAATTAAAAETITGKGAPARMISIDAPGGVSVGGDKLSGSPVTVSVDLAAFSIDETSVTNGQFRRFVKETKYKTEAETYGWSFVHAALLDDATREASNHVENAPHWKAVEGAWWRKPEGPKGRSLADRWDHPAVHVSRTDAARYCEWATKRLPTEAEWEWAARGGRKHGVAYPWGRRAVKKDGKHRMNIWQGAFPDGGTAEDGYAGVAPAKAFPANKYGLYGMVGNVWEWTSDRFAPLPPNQPAPKPGQEQYVLRGGSYVDSADGSFNHKASVYTRMGNTADSGGHNTGFRCARGKGGGHDAIHRALGGGGGGAGGAGGGGGGMDQETIQRILAERGKDGLMEYLAKVRGVENAQVMTPGELKKRHAEIKAMRRQLEEKEGRDVSGVGVGGGGKPKRKKSKKGRKAKKKRKAGMAKAEGSAVTEAALDELAEMSAEEVKRRMKHVHTSYGPDATPEQSKARREEL